MSVHDYRLTDADEELIGQALTDFLARLKVGVIQSGHAWDVHSQLSSSNTCATVRRLMAHSVGCSLDDLRDVEIQYIDNEIEERRMFS